MTSDEEFQVKWCTCFGLNSPEDQQIEFDQMLQAKWTPTEQQRLQGIHTAAYIDNNT